MEWERKYCKLGCCPREDCGALLMVKLWIEHLLGSCGIGSDANYNSGLGFETGSFE